MKPEEMTIEYAIKLLDPATTVETIAELEYYAGFSGKKAAIHAIDDACEIACKAMEKLIPKKPNIHGYREGREINTISYTCPSCNKRINIADYCEHCGQAIKWGE